MFGSGVLARLIKQGTVTIIAPDGASCRVGQGTPDVTLRLVGKWTPLRIALHPELQFGESYMEGRLVVEQGDIADFLEILLMNARHRDRLPKLVNVARRVRRAVRVFQQFNPAPRARRNVAHHYDLSGELYDLFLDADRQYSCAYFRSPKDSLEAAQIAKKRHIAAKLHLARPGLKVLDIGSGWGGLALDLARDSGAEVLGVTLSTEQLALAASRARAAGLSEYCRFELTDYRALGGRFDRIVSVGMFEHVGVQHYDAYFGKIAELLAEDGVALVHTIGRHDGPGATNPWIRKNIFPGGYIPAMSEVLPAIERAGLMVTDMECLRLHYAETLKAWRQRFRKNWARAAALYDERFCRMWDFYLASSEMTFRYDAQAVFQIQLTKRMDTLPITRDYMYETERTMRFAGRSHEAA
jgi:cyclopropane-fatty-acyl-phospholipid synthase